MGNHLAELMNIGGHIVVRWQSLLIPAERSADGAPIVIYLQLLGADPI
jgi:hypothetical protein